MGFGGMKSITDKETGQSFGSLHEWMNSKKRGGPGPLASAMQIAGGAAPAPMAGKDYAVAPGTRVKKGFNSSDVLDLLGV